MAGKHVLPSLDASRAFPDPAIWDAWAGMWNGEVDPTTFVAEVFRLHLGAQAAAEKSDAIASGADLGAFVSAFRATRPGLRYRTVGAPFVTPDGRIGAVWTGAIPGVLERSGIDVLQVEDGRVVEAWSVTGERAFDPAGQA